MKNLIYTSALFVGILLFPNLVHAQFFGKNNKEITECNCNSRVDELNVIVPIPDLSNYDIAVFRLRQSDGTILSTLSFGVKGLANKSSETFNLLNPEFTKTYRRLLGGKEERLFEGKDISLSYNKLCEKIDKDYEIHMEVLGVRQVGEKITYEVTNRSTGEITGKKQNVYDNGTLLYTSEKLKVYKRKNLKEKMYAVVSYAGYIGSLGLGALGFSLMSQPYK